MIRKTLRNTQSATYSIDLPDPNRHGMPAAKGTGFFVSPDGWFVTAAHVVTENGHSDGPPRTDIDKAWLMKETRPGIGSAGMCQNVQLDLIDAALDFALLKVDFQANANKVQLSGLRAFPFLKVSTRELEEGEPVYSFGYPLSHSSLVFHNSTATIGHTAHCPRTTSAVVAATMDTSKMLSTSSDPLVYVLDKALNYGNSGGPIVASETGNVHAFCSRFQPVEIPQHQLEEQLGFLPWIYIPSLYSVVSRLSNSRILSEMRARGIPISES
jgi:serine protease Do